MDPMGYDFDELRQDGFFFRPTEMFSPRDKSPRNESEEPESRSRDETGRHAQEAGEQQQARSRAFDFLVGRPLTPSRTRNQVDVNTALHSHPVHPRRDSGLLTTSNSSYSQESYQLAREPAALLDDAGPKHTIQPVGARNMAPAYLNDVLPSQIPQDQLPAAVQQTSPLKVPEPSKEHTPRPLTLVDRRVNNQGSVGSSNSKESSPTTPNSARTDRTSVTTTSTNRSSIADEFEPTTGAEAEQLIKSGISAQWSRRSSLSARNTVVPEGFVQDRQRRSGYEDFRAPEQNENDRPESQAEAYKSNVTDDDAGLREFGVTPEELHGKRFSLSDFRFPGTFFDSDSDEPQLAPHDNDPAPATF